MGRHGEVGFHLLADPMQALHIAFGRAHAFLKITPSGLLDQGRIAVGRLIFGDVTFA